MCWSCTCTVIHLLSGLLLNCSALTFSSSASMCSSSFLTDWLLSWSTFCAPYSMDRSYLTVFCLFGIRGHPWLQYSGIIYCTYTFVYLFLNLDILLYKTVNPSGHLFEQTELSCGLMVLLLYSICYLGKFFFKSVTINYHSNFIK